MAVRESHKGYDLLAPVYDMLVKIVFNNHLHHAQQFFLNRLLKDQHILIVGGGRGKILEAIDQQNIPLKITYLDASGRMVCYASRYATKNLDIKFITGKAENFIPPEKYDVLITPFFLDQFEGHVLKEIIYNLSGFVRKQGIWIATDFNKTKKFRHRFLVKCMYQFFKLFTGIRAEKLSDYVDLIGKAEMTLTESEQFHDGFITSALFLKK
ncbi:MAG: class I SAM-dependent methyltransferase [Cyclobacteriaceae bacterium]|nr:class I SAM-dependent methyltransferase [Cyclobacteriaceae bacterium]